MFRWLLTPSMLFAEIESPRLDAQTVYVLGGILGLLAIYVLIMKAVSGTRETFGRRPTIEVDLLAKADAKDLDHVKVSMKGFATTQDVDAVSKEHHLRARGLEEQISALRHDLKGESEARVVVTRDTLEQFGELREQIAAINKQGEERITKVHDRLNVIVRDVGGLEKQGEMAIQQLVGVRQTLEVLLSRSTSQPRGGGPK